MMNADLDYGERWPSDDWWLPLPDDDQEDDQPAPNTHMK